MTQAVGRLIAREVVGRLIARNRAKRWGRLKREYARNGGAA